MKVRQKLWIAAGLGMAIAAFLFVTHYRAKTAAAKFKDQLRAQGEKLSIAELIPPPPIDGPNGSPAFLIAASQLSTIPDKLLPTAMTMVKPGRARVAFSQPALPTSDSTNVWPELGARLDEHRAGFEELHAALTAPAFHFPANYRQGFSLRLPHLIGLKRAILRLNAETLFRLHTGQPAGALKAVESAARIPARFQKESILISQLVRHAIIAIAAGTTWEALQYPDWNDMQLARIQSAWESIVILHDVAPAIATERAWFLDEFENCRQSLRRFDNILGGSSTSTPLDDLAEIGTKAMGDPQVGINAFMDRFPRRWVWKWWAGYQDEIWFLTGSESYLQSARKLESGVSYVTLAREIEAAIARNGDTPDAFLLSREVDNGIHASFLKKAATAETQRRIVISAVAVKRYSQLHGKLPPNLSALLPEFLSAIPLDPMDGKPLRYQSAAGGEFLLYSIGVDGKDDDGNPKPASSANNFHWTMGKDWVWPMPASAVEVREYHDSLEQRRRQRK